MPFLVAIIKVFFERLIMREKQKEGMSLTDSIVYVLMILAVAFIVVVSIKGDNARLYFKLGLGILILVTVMIADFIGPVLGGRFDDINTAAFKNYLVYAIMDALTYVGLYVFIINVSYTKEPVHYVFLGLSVVLFLAKTWVYGRYRRLARVKPATEEDEYDVEVDTMEEEDEVKPYRYRSRD